MAKKHHVEVAPHKRKPPTRRPAHERAPKPGQHEFSPEEEAAMRQGQRASNMTPPAAPDDMDQDTGIPGAL